MTIYHNMAACRASKNVTSIGDMLCKSLDQAHRDNRVTCGVMECAKLLRCNPDNVMLCVLPEARGQHDVTLDIQHTLIEAFCWENEIKLVKVDSQEKLAKILPVVEDENNNSDVSGYQSLDVSCLLIEHPKGQVNNSDDALLLDQVAQLVNKDVYPKAVIELPV